MFVLVYVGAALLLVTGWVICRERYVDDEVPGLVSGAPTALDRPVVEVAGAEPAVTLPER
jgi:CP family cyanate transporter-like MFS transporter